MRKTCTSCGGQEFYVEMREFDMHARNPNGSKMVTEVSKLICSDCGAEYRMNG